MGAEDFSSIFDVGVDVLRTVVDPTTKRILAWTGSVARETTDSENVEWWQHNGLASRPPTPEAKSQACQAITIRMGGYHAAIASQDARGLALYGALGPGETCLYAAGATGTGQARILLKADSSINLYTREGEGGTGCAFMLRADGAITAVNPAGAAMQLGADGSAALFNASGGLSITAAGVAKLVGSTQLCLSAGSVAIGGPSGLPIAIGPQTATAVTTLQTQVTLLSVACTALGAALTALLADPTHASPSTSTAVTAAATAAAAAAVGVGTGSAAVSAAAAIIPSLRTTSD